MPQSQIQTLPLRRRSGLVARIVSYFVTTAARRRDRAQLGRLDPHLMRDIGVDPTEVREECAKPFWRS